MVHVVSTTPHPSVVQEVICRNCGATLQFVPNDVQTKRVSDYSGDSEQVRYIECPPCGHHIDIRLALVKRL